MLLEDLSSAKEVSLDPTFLFSEEFYNIDLNPPLHLLSPRPLSFWLPQPRVPMLSIELSEFLPKSGLPLYLSAVY